MNKQQKQIAIIAAAAVGILWLVLIFSGKGFLVWGSGPEDDKKLGMMKCHYFTGTGFVEKQFLYSEQGFLGRQTCPRTLKLDE